MSLYSIYRGEVYHCYHYCEARWISYSYPDGNPSTPGPVTYATPTNDDFRTFGNRETCRPLGTQDLYQRRRSTSTSVAVSGGVFYVFFPLLQDLHNTCSAIDRRALSAAWELAREKFPLRRTTIFEYERASWYISERLLGKRLLSCEKDGTQTDGWEINSVQMRRRRLCKNRESLKTVWWIKNWLLARVSVCNVILLHRNNYTRASCTRVLNLQ